MPPTATLEAFAPRIIQADPSATPTNTFEPSPTPTRESEVAGGAVTPSGPPEDPVDNPEPLPSGGAESRTTSSILSPDALSTDAGVVATNFILALVLLIVLSMSSQVFNNTLDENRDHVDNLINRALAPLKRFVTDISYGWGSAPWAALAAKALGPLAVLGLTGLVYSFNEPGLGFTDESAVLFLSLVIALGISTYVFEGGQALFAERRFHIDAAVRMFPAALAIAVAFVLISRLTEFHAPIFYGFVASAALLGPGQIDRRHDALATTVAAVALLLISLAAWALLIPLRNAADEGNAWSQLPSQSAALVFAGGIQGLVFTMLPIRFSDGAKIASISRLLWLVLTIVPLFVFCWALINPEAEEFNALLEGRVLTVIALVGAYAGAAVAVWLFFHLRITRGTPPGGPPRLQHETASSARRSAFPQRAQPPDPVDPPRYSDLYLHRNGS